MASTTKIRKSKHLSYQKQGFLYLVFILFLFFTQAGEYVIHYTSLAKTQKELNTYLEGRLANLNLSDENASAYRDAVLERVSSLEEINTEFENYSEKNIAGIDQLRESRFSEIQIRRGSLGRTYSELWEQQQNQSQGAWTPEFVEDYEGRRYAPTQFFFRETPHAVIPSVVAHTKTAFLVEALSDLNQEALVFQTYDMQPLEESSFSTVYKKQLFLGENFEMELQAVADNDSIERIAINDREQSFMRTEDGVAFAYRPQKWGSYFVEIATTQGRFYTNFEVVRPRIQFTPQQTSVALVQGTKTQLSIDQNLLPNDISFDCEHATLKYNEGVLDITPLATGAFTLILRSGDQIWDELSLYAQAPQKLTVSMANTLGNPSTLQSAHRLQSDNPNFQVLGYDAVFYPSAGGQPQTWKSASRLLKPEIQDVVMKTSGVVHFKNIELLASDGRTRIAAEPLILRNDE